MVNDDLYTRVDKINTYKDFNKQEPSFGDFCNNEFSLPYGRGLISIDNSFDNNMYFGMPDKTYERHPHHETGNITPPAIAGGAAS